MTTAVVRPADDPRHRRGPVGRRALQVVLFLGGLLALGLLFGAHAHADQRPLEQVHGATAGAHAAASESASAVPESVPVVPSVPAAKSVADKDANEKTPTDPVTALPVAAVPARPAAAPDEAHPRLASTTQPAAGSAAQPAAVRPATTEPIGDRGRGSRPVATEPVRGTVRSAAEPVRHAVRQLALPGSQVTGQALGTVVNGVRHVTELVPGELSLPRLPLPGLPCSGLPCPELPSPATPDAPSAGSPPIPDASDSAARTPAAPRAATVSVSSPTAPWPGAYSAPREAAGAAHRVAAADHRPEHREPVGPDGDRGRSASAEAHPPRGADQPAAPFTDGPSSFGLVRGAGLPATAAPVRDRSGDILEFPG